jgi:hypothetical protein
MTAIEKMVYVLEHGKTSNAFNDTEIQPWLSDSNHTKERDFKLLEWNCIAYSLKTTNQQIQNIENHEFWDEGFYGMFY